MISVVVPLLNEEAIVSRLHDALVTALRAVDSTWEVVYVDDGSRDRTLELLLGLREQDERVCKQRPDKGERLTVKGSRSTVRKHSGNGCTGATLGSQKPHPKRTGVMLGEWTIGRAHFRAALPIFACEV